MLDVNRRGTRRRVRRAAASAAALASLQCPTSTLLTCQTFSAPTLLLPKEALSSRKELWRTTWQPTPFGDTKIAAAAGTEDWDFKGNKKRRALA